MTIPFTAEQFYGVFRDYNDAVWPAQLLLFALAFAAVALALRPQKWSGVGVSAILGFLWAWIAVVYHLAFFTRISPPAYARSPLVAPLLWCFVGAQAAFLLDVPPDLGLVAAAAVGIGLLVTARQQSGAWTS